MDTCLIRAVFFVPGENPGTFSLNSPRSIRTPVNADNSTDVFPIVASLCPKSNVCEPQPPNDFSDVKPFVLMLASQIKDRIQLEGLLATSSAGVSRIFGKFFFLIQVGQSVQEFR